MGTLELEVRRQPSLQHATIGRLWINGVESKWTLEDVVREKPGVPVSNWKVRGETAIPAGRYRVIVTYSERFRRDLPLLVGVPGYVGVRIHPGNFATDTEGCILVGESCNGEAIYESKKAFAEVFERIEAALEVGDEVWITVKNPPGASISAA